MSIMKKSENKDIFLLVIEDELLSNISISPGFRWVPTEGCYILLNDQNFNLMRVSKKHVKLFINSTDPSRSKFQEEIPFYIRKGMFIQAQKLIGSDYYLVSITSNGRIRNSGFLSSNSIDLLTETPFFLKADDDIRSAIEYGLL